MSDRTWSIGELAEEFDTTLRTIRFYEDRGLLTPERAGQTRIFHDRDRVRLQLILRGPELEAAHGPDGRRSGTITPRAAARGRRSGRRSRTSC